MATGANRAIRRAPNARMAWPIAWLAVTAKNPGRFAHQFDGDLVEAALIEAIARTKQGNAANKRL
jgi:hypothetical protein